MDKGVSVTGGKKGEEKNHKTTNWFIKRISRLRYTTFGRLTITPTRGSSSKFKIDGSNGQISGHKNIHKKIKDTLKPTTLATILLIINFKIAH